MSKTLGRRPVVMLKERRVAAVVLSAAGVLASAGTLSAAPVAGRFGARPMPVLVSHNLRSGGGLVRTTAPPFTSHAFAAAPIKPLPLHAQPSRLTLVPLFIPRLGFAAPAPLTADACGDARSGVRWSVVPATPFVPIDCLRDAALRRAPPLTPGENKDALYGRAYSPRDLDGP